MSRFFVNGEVVDFRGDPETPLLWTLRDQLGLTGTKFGCGAGLCGACTVHLDGQAIRSCVTPVAAIEGKRVVTIEASARPRAPASRMACMPRGSRRTWCSAATASRAR